jgi:hypothetical protein
MIYILENAFGFLKYVYTQFEVYIQANMIALLSFSLLPLGVALAQNVTAGTPTFANSSSRIAPTATATQIDISVEDLWNFFVGPVQTASVNTTVAATPIPTSELIPPPGLAYPSFPNGQQIPAIGTNSSWKFPSGFWWGVASAAFQVEGAVKAEGRGPSIWDVLLHRVTRYSTANETGDVADNQYYLYKQGDILIYDLENLN